MRIGVGNHINESDHLRFVDGELDETEVEIVEDHLATCMECRDFNDDLAAASDGLTAFLNRADFQPRALAYGPRVGWWTSPIGKAAAIVGLFVGLGVPVAFFLRIAEPNTPLGELAPVPAADASSHDLSPTSPLAPQASVPVPAVPPVPRPAPSPRGIGGARSSFTIDFNSWQAGGELKLVFSDSDAVVYTSGAGSAGTLASINTMTGRMFIRTTAIDSSDHEIWIPASYRPEDITVRIAGRRIPFTATDYVTGDETFVLMGVVPTEVARISLQVPEGLRRRR